MHHTLHSKCHHQITYSKVNLKIDYPLSYTRKICDYSISETELINHSIESFDWSKFSSDKNGQAQVELFKKKLLNIVHNFMPNKIIVCDDKSLLR